MKSHIITAASAIAIMTALPAFAASEKSMPKDKNAQSMEQVQPQAGNNPDTPDMPHKTTEDLKRGWEQTKDAVTGANEEPYETIQAILVYEDNDINDPRYVTIDRRMTARNLLGKNVYDQRGEVVAEVQDIIINNQGEASHVILSSGGFLGLGEKLVAFDYELMGKPDAQGRVVMAVDKDMMEQANRFSYDKTQESDSTRVMPSNHYSLSRMIGHELIDDKGEKVANVDNFYIQDDKVTHMIVSFDEFLGMGGERAAIDYDALSMVVTDDAAQYQLSERQSQYFKQYKNNISKDM